MTQHHQHGSQDGGHAIFSDERMALMISAEGESAHPITAGAIERSAIALRLGGGGEVRRIADLGCGPGVNALALADAFPTATVAAIDGSATMRAAARKRAEDGGLADRIEVKAIDLDDDLRSLGSYDLVWSAQTLHHLSDESAALTRLAALINPGGVLCLLERLWPMELRPADVTAAPGLWERVATAQAAWLDGNISSGGPAAERYTELVKQAGLEVVDSGPLEATIEMTDMPGLDTLIDRYVQTALNNFTDRLQADDVEALRSFGSKPSVRGSRVEVRQSRVMVIGRLPV